MITLYITAAIAVALIALCMVVVKVERLGGSGIE